MEDWLLAEISHPTLIRVLLHAGHVDAAGSKVISCSKALYGCGESHGLDHHKRVRWVKLLTRQHGLAIMQPISQLTSISTPENCPGLMQFQHQRHASRRHLAAR